MAYKKPKVNAELKGFGKSLQCNRVPRRGKMQCGKTSGDYKNIRRLQKEKPKQISSKQSGYI